MASANAVNSGSRSFKEDNVASRCSEGAISETTPLLVEARAVPSLIQAVQEDPRALALSYAKTRVEWLLSPLLTRLPSVDESLDRAAKVHPAKALLLEISISLNHSIPTFLAHLQEHSVVLAPIISIGHLSTTGLAATAVATMINNVTGIGLINGLTSALDHVLDASSPSSRFSLFWCLCTACILVATLVPIVSLWATIDRSLQPLIQDSETIRLTSLNLHLTAIGIPAFAANEVFKRYLNSQGLSSVHTRLSTLAATLNATLNQLLVHGPPYVRLGFAGAPIATAACYNFVAVASGLYILFSLRPTHRRRAENDEPNVPAPERPTFLFGLSLISLLGLGGVARVAAASWSKNILGFSTTVLGPTALGTQAVLMATTSTAHLVSRAIGENAQMRMRQILDVGEVERFRIATGATAMVMVGALLTLCTLLRVFCTSWAFIFTSDLAVASSVAATIPIIQLYIVAQGLGLYVDHILRVLQKPAVYPGLTLSIDYVAGIPVGAWLAFNDSWGIAGLWTGLTASLMISFAISFVILVQSILSMS